MAPTRSRPRPRPRPRPQLTKFSAHDSKVSIASPGIDISSTKTTKRARRESKHTDLISKARLSSDKKLISKVHKQRRPSEKLQSTQNLFDLFNSLPSVEPSKSKSTARETQQHNTTKLVSRLGLQKRRDHIDKAEQKLFSSNLATILAASDLHNTSDQAQTSSQKPHNNNLHEDERNKHWALLKKHISQSIRSL